MSRYLWWMSFARHIQHELVCRQKFLMFVFGANEFNLLQLELKFTEHMTHHVHFNMVWDRVWITLPPQNKLVEHEIDFLSITVFNLENQSHILLLRSLQVGRMKWTFETHRRAKSKRPVLRPVWGGGKKPLLLIFKSIHNSKFNPKFVEPYNI